MLSRLVAVLQRYIVSDHQPVPSGAALYVPDSILFIFPHIGVLHYGDDSWLQETTVMTRCVLLPRETQVVFKTTLSRGAIKEQTIIILRFL